MDCCLPGSSVHGILQARILERVAIPFSRGSSRPRDQTPISCIAGGFFTIWATREDIKDEKWSESQSVVSDSLWSHGLYCPWNSPGQNTEVVSLSLLQGIILTQESNWGLLNCRWIFNQLSYYQSPKWWTLLAKEANCVFSGLGLSVPPPWKPGWVAGRLSCGAEHLICGIWCYLWVELELAEWSDIQMVPESLLLVWGKLATPHLTLELGVELFDTCLQLNSFINLLLTSGIWGYNSLLLFCLICIFS